MSQAIVVDTMIASAWLGVRESPRKTRWEAVLSTAPWVLPFTVVAEMRFGAEVAGWGARRRGGLDRLVTRAGVVPPLQEVTRRLRRSQDLVCAKRAWPRGQGARG